MQENRNNRLINLKLSLEIIIKDIEALEAWNSINVHKLSKLNDPRHELADEIIDLGIMSA